MGGIYKHYGHSRGMRSSRITTVGIYCRRPISKFFEVNDLFFIFVLYCWHAKKTEENAKILCWFFKVLKEFRYPIPFYTRHGEEVSTSTLAHIHMLVCTYLRMYEYIPSSYLGNGSTHFAEIWCVVRDQLSLCCTQVMVGLRTCARTYPFFISGNAEPIVLKVVRNHIM